MIHFNFVSFLWLLFYSGFACALLISALGFIRSDWFISIGYGLSITLIACLFYYQSPVNCSFVSQLQLLLLATYGLRLTGYLILRERSASYRDASRRRHYHLSWKTKLCIWLSVSLLYIAMAFPAAISLRVQSPTFPLVAGIGVVIMVIGLILETLADYQKSTAKRHRPDTFVSSGLFTLIRCPNYFGEMLFWTGHFFIALVFFHSIWSLLFAAIGWVCIQLIMLGAARRLEIKQQQRYGQQPDFQDYTQRVPILFPFVPIYSLKHWKIHLG